jgi:hypothetical protein
VIIAKLQPRFATDLAEQLGMSLEDTAGAVLRADLSKIPDAKDRAVLERARELIELTGWPNPPHRMTSSLVLAEPQSSVGSVE